MATTTVSVSAQLPSVRRVSDGIALVAHGETCIPVPAAALEPHQAYPLFGIQHGTVAIPNAATLQELKRHLITEYAQGTPWHTLWPSAITSQPQLFSRYAFVLLPTQSRKLPAADLVFKITPRFSQIPQQHMAMLTAGQRQRVCQAVSEAYTAFPNRTFYYLEPVFQRPDPEPQLANPIAVQRLAQRHENVLHRFCQHWAWLISRQIKVEKELERQLEARRFRRSEWRNRRTSRLSRLVDDTAYAVFNVFHPIEAHRQRQRLAELLARDPIVAFCEDSWLLSTTAPDQTPIHPAGTKFFRMVTHFDDTWSKCYLRLR